MMGAKKVGFLTAAVVSVALVGVVLTQVVRNDKSQLTDPEDLIFTWDAPTVGTPVVFYEVEIRKHGAESDEITQATTETNRYVVAVSEWLVKHEVRVRGVDAEGRRGPWSDWSLEYDRGLPDAQF